MLTVEETLPKILATAAPINTTKALPLNDAFGRILAEDQYSTIDVPPADNSAMDGFAINIGDLNQQEATQEVTQKTIKLPVSQIITAGSAPQSLTAGTAARIFTGAEIPAGANAVIMQEQCEIIDDHVVLPTDFLLNNNIRPQGQDIKRGGNILEKGRYLQAEDIGLLASIGIDTVPVYDVIQVAIFSTGSELVEPGNKLSSGKIYNSNRYLLTGLLKQLGVMVIDLGVVEDNLAATKEKLQQAAASDLIITTGGVSVGDEDHIKQAISDLGQLHLWRIALKPGKPLAFGKIANTPLFGLPGNPVSSFITFLLFVQPFIKKLQGRSYQPPRAQKLKANFSTRANPKRQEYLRVRINGDYADIYENQSSGVLSSIVWADGLALVPIGTAIATDDIIHVIPFENF